MPAQLVRRHPEPAVLGLVILATLAFSPRPPGGIYGLGVVDGAILGLSAVAVVLVYRSSQVVNVAQISVAVVASTLFASLVTFEPLVRWARHLCTGSCLQPTPGWAASLDYALAALLAIALAAVLSWLTYQLVIRPLAGSPPLVGTVATVFLVAVYGDLAQHLPGWLESRQQKAAEVAVGAPAPPFGLKTHLGGVVFTGASVLTLAVVAVGVPMLAVFLRRSATGVAIRSASQAPAASAAVGVDVARVTGRVWALAGLLAGLAGVLSTMGSAPPPAGAAIDAPTLARVLAAAVVARFVSLPLATAAAVVIGVLDTTVVYAFGSSQPVDAALFAIVGAVLLLQRAGAARLRLAITDGWRSAVEIRPVPAVLRRVPQVRTWSRTGLGAGAVILLAAPWLLSPSQTTLAAYTLIALVIFVSLLVLTGWGGQISLGQLAFAAVGAYVTAVTGLPAPVAVALAMLASACFAVIVGIPALKLRGLELAIMTLVVNLAVSTYLLSSRYLGSALPSSLSRPRGLGLRLDDERTFFYVVLAVAAAACAAVAGLRRSAFARELLAARDNDTAAAAYGVSPVRVRLTAFAVSGALAGLAGALIAYQSHAVIPDSFSADRSLSLFLYAVIGGFGAIWAPIVAAGYFAVVTVFQLPLWLTQLLTGVGGLALLVLSRGGLAQALASARDSWLRSIARRQRINVLSLSHTPDVEGQRLGIAPHTRAGGASVFVVPRYRIDGQYGIRRPEPRAADRG